MGKHASADVTITSDAIKTHRCMRCGEEFPCPTPTTCKAGADVMPRYVDVDGAIVEHCPIAPTWDWIRAYGQRMRALPPALPAVQTIAVADVRPTDVIVIECDGIVSHEAGARMQAELSLIWPDRKVVVFDQGSRMRIARDTVTP